MINIISYDGFWKVLKERGISQYKLIMQHGVSNSQLNHIRKGGHITTATINKLCKLLDCEIGDIVAYVPDGDEMEQSNEQGTVALTNFKKLMCSPFL